jgi:hypothetical protein
MVQIELDPQGQPQSAVYAQHTEAERCPWSSVDRDVTGQPNVYVGAMSHAAYFGRVLGGAEEESADGNQGALVSPVLVPIDDGSPSWVAWPGAWGDSKAGFPEEHDSPQGPRFHAQWEDPTGWAAAAGSCLVD